MTNWEESWGPQAAPEPVNDVVNLTIERAEKAEKKTEELMGLLGQLYHWCLGLNDFRPDASLPRKVKAALGDWKPEPEIVTLLETETTRITGARGAGLVRMTVMSGTHTISFKMDIDQCNVLIGNLTDLWKPRSPLDE